MRIALSEAMLGAQEGGIPIGSALVRDGRLIARGHNKRVQQGSQVLHAEIDCLNNAGRIRGFRDAILYSTLMPCYMCAGAIVQFGIRKVIVGEDVNFKGALHFLQEHGVEVVNLQSEECIGLLRKFIDEHSDVWFEDIGE